MKKLLSVLLAVILCSVISFPTVTNSLSVSAKKKTLYVSTKKLSIYESGKIKVTLKGKGTLSYSIANTNIAQCTWDKKWKGNSIYLKIKGKNYGSTTITIKNKKTKEKIKVKLKVKLATIKLPKTPFTITNYDWNGRVDSIITVTKVWVKKSYFDNFDKETTFKLYAKGTKTYDAEGDYISQSSWIPWKLYKDGIVKDSDEILTTDIATGESFESYDYISDLKAGIYTVKFLNYKG